MIEDQNYSSGVPKWRAKNATQDLEIARNMQAKNLEESPEDLRSSDKKKISRKR